MPTIDFKYHMHFMKLLNSLQTPLVLFATSTGLPTPTLALQITWMFRIKIAMLGVFHQSMQMRPQVQRDHRDQVPIQT